MTDFRFPLARRQVPAIQLLLGLVGLIAVGLVSGCPEQTAVRVVVDMAGSGATQLRFAVVSAGETVFPTTYTANTDGLQDTESIRIVLPKVTGSVRISVDGLADGEVVGSASEAVVVAEGFTTDVALVLGASVCGNGTQDTTESCDDGNTTPGDGCSALCFLTVDVRDAGGLDAGELDGGADAGDLDAGGDDAGFLDAGELDAGDLDGGADGGETDASLVLDAGPLVDGGVLDWWQPAWPSRVRLSFPSRNSSDVGGLVLPLAITVRPEILNDTGLRLVTADGVPLAHERAGSTLWVQVPAAVATGEVHFFAYGGNPTAPAYGHPADPWGPEARGVWHLNGTVTDSSPLNADFVEAGGLGNEEGAIGPGHLLLPAGVALKAPTETPFTRNADAFTTLAWVKTPNTEGRRALVSLAAAEGGPRVELGFRNNGSLRYRARLGSTNGPTLDSTSNLLTSDWSLVAGSVDFETGEMATYVNGVEVGFRAFGGSEALPNELNPIGAIGANDDGETEVLNGYIDEVRLFSRSFTPEEIALLYDHEVAAGSLATAGIIETIAPDVLIGVPVVAIDDDTAVGATSRTIVDLRTNDVSDQPRLTVTEVFQLGGVGATVEILTDGRVEITAPDTLVPLTLTFAIGISDGIFAPAASVWTVTVLPIN